MSVSDPEAGVFPHVAQRRGFYPVGYVREERLLVANVRRPGGRRRQEPGDTRGGVFGF